MTFEKLTRITNLWSKIYRQDNHLFSRVVIESTCSLHYQLKKLNQKVITLIIYGAIVNMYCETIKIYDGLINEITIQQKEENRVVIHIALNHQAPCKITCAAGLPAQTCLDFDRTRLCDIFSPLRIVIDPGHGGKNAGGRGPVDLLEKDVVLTMAGQLKDQLEQAGAQIFLTRQSDQPVPERQRFNLARVKKAHVFISLHTHYDKNPKINGLAVKYNPASGDSLRLARITCEELVKKIKRNVREIRADKQLKALADIPGITVEPLTISNWVEEGLLRNPYLYEKIALGILSGLKRFFSG